MSTSVLVWCVQVQAEAFLATERHLLSLYHQRRRNLTRRHLHPAHGIAGSLTRLDGLGESLEQLEFLDQPFQLPSTDWSKSHSLEVTDFVPSSGGNKYLVWCSLR